MWGWVIKILGQVILSSAAGALWNLITSKFKFQKSPDERLGRAEVIVEQQTQIIQGVHDAKKIQDIVDSDPNGAANDWLHRPIR